MIKNIITNFENDTQNIYLLILCKMFINIQTEGVKYNEKNNNYMFTIKEFAYLINYIETRRSFEISKYVDYEKFNRNELILYLYKALKTIIIENYENIIIDIKLKQESR